MKYIEEIKIQGFQSHHNTALELIPGLNVITGPSDSGKTAIIRALRWALYNEPSGDSFINDKLKKAKASVVIGNNNITRTRGMGENSYDVNGLHFEGFGVGVPDEVTWAHGMAKAEVGDWKTSLNIAFQMDPPFLLTESTGQTAKVLGYLAGTEVIDMASKDTNGDLYRARQEKSSLELQKENLKERLEEYEHLDEWEKINKELAYIRGQLKALTKLMEDLVFYRALYAKNSQEIEAVTKTIEATEFIPKLYQSIFDIEYKHQDYSRMGELMTQDSRLKQDINLANMTLIDLRPTLLQALERTVTDGLVALDRRTYLERLEEEFEFNRRDRGYQNRVIEKTNLLPVKAKIVVTLNAYIPKKEQLDALFKKNQWLEAGIRSHKEQLNRLEPIFNIEPLLLDCAGMLQRATGLEETHRRWLIAGGSMASHRIKIEDLNVLIDNTTVQFKSVLKKLGKCPVCYSDITTDKINEIIGGM